MFDGAKAFDQPLANWTTSNVVYMDSMFSGAIAFSQDITGWSTPALTDFSDMFYENQFKPATAWQAKFERIDGSGSLDGPPSSWELKV